MPSLIRIICYVPILLFAFAAYSAEPFSFQNHKDPIALAEYLRKTLPIGASREGVEHLLIAEGQATAYPVPFDQSTVVYLYDVNLCAKYVWRWNVSAKYNSDATLADLYIYDRNIHDPGKKYSTRTPAQPDTSKKFHATMPRPEATEGEHTLSYLINDVDGDPSTIQDQYIIGAMPQYADPDNFGKIVMLLDAPIWQSPFGADAPPVNNYPKCQNKS